MWTGLGGSDRGVGTMPVCSKSTAERAGSAEKRVGCLPVNLRDSGLVGLVASMDKETLELGADILSEAWAPPMDKEDFDKILGCWAVLQTSLMDTNKDVEDMKKKGVRYHTVNCMESPATPEMVPVFYKIHQKIAEVTTRINSGPGKEGGFVRTSMIGPGVCRTIFLPEVSSELTIIDSLNQAKKEVGW